MILLYPLFFVHNILYIMIVLDLPEGIGQYVADATQRLEYSMYKELVSHIVHERLIDVKRKAALKFDAVVPAFIESQISKKLVENTAETIDKEVFDNLANLAKEVVETGIQNV